MNGYSTDVDLAKKLASFHHNGQTDKSGQPYIFHPERVAGRLSVPEEIVVAWLHDTVEDTDLSLEEIEKMFGEKTAEAVEAITRRKEEQWDNYINRVSQNIIASHVKISDLIDNSNLSRLTEVGLKDIERQKKYNQALFQLLKAELEGMP